MAAKGIQLNTSRGKERKTTTNMGAGRKLTGEDKQNIAAYRIVTGNGERCKLPDFSVRKINKEILTNR